ncbi:esterase/lipase family protein [Gordonia sp. (in: high G+C Gram-positive bacteria)]|uniref:esterase/lipase family protein n=1 Tax=Gordonia sp. (in: high G+C Gram-positive bacteria) TaxID=84139 RepID=UPI0039E4416A
MRLLASLSAAAAVLIGTGAGAAQAVPFPVTTDVPTAIAANYFASAQTPPPGANRWSCHSGHNPVVLLHATAMNQAANFAYLSPMLANAGYCVFSLTYGQTSWSGNTGGLAKREASAYRQVVPFLDRVLAATGAAKVDLIGHSQGGPIAQLASQRRASRIGTIVGLSASSRGHSDVDELQHALPARAPGQNYWGPRHPGIRYVNLATRFDHISTPYPVTLMPPGPGITNTLIQHVCPASRVGHVGMAFSPTVGALVRNALDPAHRVRVPCGENEFPE